MGNSYLSVEFMEIDLPDKLTWLNITVVIQMFFM